MSNTISDSFGTGITLSPSFYADPVTISDRLAVSVGDALVAPSLWTIDVTGSLVAEAGNGIRFGAGGNLDNQGLISASSSAVISTSGMPFDIVNEAGATLAGGGTGVAVRLGGNVLTSSMSNEGVIDAAGGGTAIQLGAANATNGSTGLIEGGDAGVMLGNVSTFVNEGTVVGNAGIIVPYDQNYVTIVEAGLVSAAVGDAISFTSTPISPVTDELVMLPGAVLDGRASGGGVANLVFAGTTAGSIADAGQEFLQFQTISIANGASWDFVGTTQLDGALKDNGNIFVHPGDALTFDSGVSGSGTIDLAGGSVAFADTVASGVTVDFTAPGSTLLFSQAHPFLGTIKDFTGGDTIKVSGFGLSQQVSGTVSGDVLTLNNGMAPLSITFATAPEPLAVVPIGGTYPKTYEIVVPCFRQGTRLLTPDGLRPVETLGVGDAIVTRSGAARRIVWRGQRRIDCSNHPRPEAVLPVLVEQDAFGPGQPCRDLYLSPDHALWIEDSLIEVKNLVNGVSIRQVEVMDVIYHHVELAFHDVVLAEMLPAETYLDCGNRPQFSDGKRPVPLFADFATLHRDPDRACAPVLDGGAKLARIRARLLERLAATGTRSVPGAFSLFADGKELRPAPCADARLTYFLPRTVRFAEIRSTSSRPAELDPAASDYRRLGIAIRELALDGRPVDLCCERLRAGFHAPEQGPHGWFRWTDGAARIDVAGARDLAFTVQGVAQVWEVPLPSSPRPVRAAASGFRW